jgi:multicomponent Na+:H+ antiporter subunit D
VPPLSGFLAKLAIVLAAMQAHSFVLAGVALLVSLLTLLSMARVWHHVVWKPAPPSGDRAPLGPRVLAPVAALVVLIIGLTVGAGPVFEASTTAAEQLLHPEGYIQAVLGAR